ncbi:MAG: DUF4375 domain-containing protein, partial [Desulfobacterales bacterium]|nr:DUF4375 domain-containing protein [Desulfobacterales bacterium]
SAVYFVSNMDVEVNNGGFYQFFYNSGRGAVTLAREGAELMGLPALSAVVSQALQIEETERSKMAKLKENGTLEAFFESYNDISFDPADDEFMNLKIDFKKVIASWIRSHGELFDEKAD